MGQHQSVFNKIGSKEKGVDLSITDITRYEEFLDYIDFTDDDQIPNLRAVKYVAGLVGGAAVSIAIEAGSYEYTLSAPELAAVNAITRTPVFTIISDSGEQFFDMPPIYTPYNTPGSYTSIVIQLNSDANDFLAQFS